MIRPILALSVSMHDFGDYGGVGVQRPLFEAGGLPMMLPQLPESIDASLERVDGLVLAPGRDIDPARYGEEPDPLLAPTEPRRDEFEFAILPAALERGIPVLGICRGMQIINVGLGGTMVQDVTLRDEWQQHPSDPGWTAWKQMEKVALESRERIPDHPRHRIAIAEPSILASALGRNEASVNSFHHQAVGELGDGLRATAVAPDGVIEAIELEGLPVLGVQWELQEEWRLDPSFRAVFRWFVEAASSYAARRSAPPAGCAAGARP
jgi:putative glutamine amidotransferase